MDPNGPKVSTSASGSTSPASTLAAAPMQPAVVEPNDALIQINWSFFFPDKLYLDRILPAELTLSELKLKSSDLRNKFWDVIIEEYDMPTLKSRTLRFWKLDEKVSGLEAAKMDWGINHLQDFHDHLQPIPLAMSFAKTIPQEQLDDDYYLHLIITDGYPSGITSIRPGPTQVDGILKELPPQRLFRETLADKGPTPLEASRDYEAIQLQPTRTIYDGRYARNGGCTIAPPVGIFHSIFEVFRDRARTATPDRDTLVKVHELMKTTAKIHTGDRTYTETLRSTLVDILNIPLVEKYDKTYSSGVYAFDLDSLELPAFLIEVSSELGQKSPDDTTRAGLAMKWLWADDDEPSTTKVRPRCCCPTFILAGGGPWLGVLGGVFTDKVIVQRLTDMMWITQSSTYEDSRVYGLAQVMVALRECLKDLQEYYTNILTENIPKFKPNEPHPRFFPYPTSYEVGGRTVRWNYVKTLESDDSDPRCITYLAEVEEHPSLSQGSEIVVKFVERYGAEVHQFLAQEGHAPTLWYCGPFGPSVPMMHLPPTQSPPSGIILGHLQMVVMDFVEPANVKPATSMKDQLTRILTKLHMEGYVFGDLREPNVILDAKGTVQLIDFDWAGRYDRSYVDVLGPNDPLDLIPADICTTSESVDNDADFVVYPLNISKTAFGNTGASDFVPIRPVHDWRLLRGIQLQDVSFYR